MNTLNTTTSENKPEAPKASLNIKVEVSKDDTKQLCKGIMLADYCRGIMLAD